MNRDFISFKSDGNTVGAEDYLALLEAVKVIHSCRTLDSFPSRVMEALTRLIPCNLAAYNEVNVKLGRMASLAVPEVPQLEALIGKWEVHMGEHPVLDYYRRTQDGQALAISDFLSVHEFHALGIYQECYAHIEAEDQLSTGIFLGDSVVVGLAFNRADRSFTMRDRTLLNLVRPHLIQAYAAAREFDEMREDRKVLKEALRSMGRGLMKFDEAHRLVECSPEVVEVLGLKGMSGGKRLKKLHEDVAAFWLSSEKSGPWTSPDLPHVKVHLQRAGGRVLGIVSEEPVGAVARQFGLSKREVEVLRWMAEGKSNQEISLLLGIAEGTAKIHVQNVLAKLGVANRGAAAAMLRDVGLRI